MPRARSGAAQHKGARQKGLGHGGCDQYSCYTARLHRVIFRIMNLTQCLAPDLGLIRADNPSAMTFEGTNTYILGQRSLAIIDPGPQDRAHLSNLLAAIDARPVAFILVTHSHKDHSPLAPALGQATGAPVLAYGDSMAGRSAIMAKLASAGPVGGGEGVDAAFRPDRPLRDGETLPFEDGDITALWTPGHMGNHMCFRWRDMVFTGDHVMGWAPSLVSPPDGDMTAYMASLHRLAQIGARVFYSGHGAPIENPGHRLAELVAHRTAREGAILSELQRGATTVSALTQAIYTDLTPKLRPAAARNVFAHLVDLHARNRVTVTPKLTPDAMFALSNKA